MLIYGNKMDLIDEFEDQAYMFFRDYFIIVLFFLFLNLVILIINTIYFINNKNKKIHDLIIILFLYLCMYWVRIKAFACKARIGEPNCGNDPYYVPVYYAKTLSEVIVLDLINYIICLINIKKKNLKKKEENLKCQE